MEKRIATVWDEMPFASFVEYAGFVYCGILTDRNAQNSALCQVKHFKLVYIWFCSNQSGNAGTELFFSFFGTVILHNTAQNPIK